MGKGWVYPWDKFSARSHCPEEWIRDMRFSHGGLCFVFSRMDSLEKLFLSSVICERHDNFYIVFRVAYL